MSHQPLHRKISDWSQLGLRNVPLAEFDAQKDDETLAEEEDSEHYTDGVDREAVLRLVAAGPGLHLPLPPLQNSEPVCQQERTGGGVGDTPPPPHGATAQHGVTPGHARRHHGAELDHGAPGELEGVKIGLEGLGRVSDCEDILYDGGVCGTACDIDIRIPSSSARLPPCLPRVSISRILLVSDPSIATSSLTNMS